MGYQVFTDFHHAGLLNSLISLFEKRFQGQVYRPIGRAWFDLGYWKVFDHPATVAQYLDIGGATPDGTPRLNEVTGYTGSEDFFYCHDISGDSSNKAITYEGFMNMHFDFVIASIPQHIAPFRKLCDSHPDKPKLIYQVGNAWNISSEEEEMVDCILASAILSKKPSKPYIEYHQEFDTSVFHPPIQSDPIGDGLSWNSYDWSMPQQNIFSFVNCFSSDQLFSFDWAIFQEVEKIMPNWVFKTYGGNCRDGAIHGDLNVADKMREARFVWHTKFGGDGYGHIIHNSAAVGRPAIVRKSYYQGKMADKLMIDGVTCLNIDGLSIEEIVAKIQFYSDPYRYLQMCQKTYENFKRVCNFDEEFVQIKQLLESLKTSRY